MNYFVWPKHLVPQRCHNCGEPGALNAHIDLPVNALLCDDCVNKYRVACDFCAEAVAWEYPCKQFDLPAYNYRSTDNWLTCERCAAFVTADNYQGLLNLAIERMFRKGIIDRNFIRQGREFVTALHQGFKKNRCGEPWRIDEQGNRAAFII